LAGGDVRLAYAPTHEVRAGTTIVRPRGREGVRSADRLTAPTGPRGRVRAAHDLSPLARIFLEALRRGPATAEELGNPLLDEKPFEVPFRVTSKGGLFAARQVRAACHVRKSEFAGGAITDGMFAQRAAIAEVLQDDGVDGMCGVSAPPSLVSRRGDHRPVHGGRVPHRRLRSLRRDRRTWRHVALDETASTRRRGVADRARERDRHSADSLR
jgi:hypothetical protein